VKHFAEQPESMGPSNKASLFNDNSRDEALQCIDVCAGHISHISEVRRAERLQSLLGPGNKPVFCEEAARSSSYSSTSAAVAGLISSEQQLVELLKNSLVISKKTVEALVGAQRETQKEIFSGLDFSRRSDENTKEKINEDAESVSSTSSHEEDVAKTVTTADTY
jgi:hypothetical protein